ncbi:papain fold toxin domain-containing protein [Nostoc sp. LPT]|nr:papain fold toxin domain-containing protein [Nostoc sp. LPT]
MFECVPCAIALHQFLIDQNISGKQVSLLAIFLLLPKLP